MEKLTSLVTAGVATCAMLMIPASALAYLAPDQVFGGQSLTLDRTDSSTYQAPPQQRAGEAVVSSQASSAAALRHAAQEELVSVDDEPMDTYVPSDDSSNRGLFDEKTQYELRQERINESTSGGPTIIIGGDGTVVDSNGNLLHSGAPRVTSTGPESTLALAAMVLATLSTIAYAAVRQRRELALS